MRPLLLLILVGLGGWGMADADEPPEIVFCSYNLENYTAGKPPSPESKFGTKPKAESSIAALVAMVGEIRPDLLGVCEMGSPERLADFQRRLASIGLHYSDTEFVAAADEDRHLALLSRFPIVSRQSQPDVRFVLNGREERVRRGILDVTVQINADYRLRCVGVHFKSKLPIPQGEALIRRLEAQKLRAHLDRILAEDSDVNLLCYGDFNDTKNEPMFQEVAGARGTAGFLADLWCEDAQGDRWTHYWKTADLYARIDYLFVSSGLFPEVNRSRCVVHRSAHGPAASDHRPIYTAIRPVEMKRR